MTEPERIYYAMLRHATVAGIKVTNPRKAIEAAYLQGRKDRERELLNPAPANIERPPGVRDWNSMSREERQEVVSKMQRVWQGVE